MVRKGCPGGLISPALIHVLTSPMGLDPSAYQGRLRTAMAHLSDILRPLAMTPPVCKETRGFGITSKCS